MSNIWRGLQEVVPVIALIVIVCAAGTWLWENFPLLTIFGVVVLITLTLLYEIGKEANESDFTKEGR